jgi:hypothetical protein
MTKNNKGRSGGDRPTPKPPEPTANYTELDPLLGWHNLAKNARINRQQKRGWQRGRR